MTAAQAARMIAAQADAERMAAARVNVAPTIAARADAAQTAAPGAVLADATQKAAGAVGRPAAARRRPGPPGQGLFRRSGARPLQGRAPPPVDPGPARRP